MEQSKIDRISQLTRIARQRELTEEEQQERQALRREYIDSVKQSLAGQLDNTVIVDPQGNRRPLKPRGPVNCEDHHGRLRFFGIFDAGVGRFGAAGLRTVVDFGAVRAAAQPRGTGQSCGKCPPSRRPRPAFILSHAGISVAGGNPAGGICFWNKLGAISAFGNGDGLL